MADYGHELLFGTFLTPTADDVERVLALAGADRAGRSRPGHDAGPPLPGALPRHAGRCCRSSPRAPPRVRVAPNVANLPLRPPAVLARSVATPRPAQRRPRRARPRRRRVLGRDRGGRRPAADRRPRRSTRSPRRSRSSARSGPRAARGPRRRRALPGPRRAPGPGAGARRRDLARRLQAADAARSPARLADGWLPSIGLRRARRRCRR